MGTWGTGQMPLSTPKYRFLALQLTSSVKLDIKIAINTQGNYCKALFIVFTTGFVLEMAHVQIRGGVADWYWTADSCAVEPPHLSRPRSMAPTPCKLRETRNSPDTWRRFARPSLPEPLPVYDCRRKRPMTRTASQRDGMASDAEVEIG